MSRIVIGDGLGILRWEEAKAHVAYPLRCRLPSHRHSPKTQPIGHHPRIFPRPRSAWREDNNKDTPKKVERPDELAAEMKAEVDKTDSTKVLLLNLMKKAEEIEELAHEIRKRSTGQSGRELRLLADVPQPLLVAAGRRTRDGRSLARREQVRPGPRDALTD